MAAERRAAAILLVGFLLCALSPAGEAARCDVRGKLPPGLLLTRAGVCRALLEGLEADGSWQGEVTLSINFTPPATATLARVDEGGRHPPISIAISQGTLGRRDIVTLGRTIAQLLRTY